MKVDHDLVIVDKKTNPPIKSAASVKQLPRLVKKGRAVVRARKSGPRRKAGAPHLPPIINATPTFGHTYRFTVATVNLTDFPVVGADLAGALGTICTVVNSKVQPYISTVRIHRITIWPAANSNPPLKASVEWGAIAGIVKDESKVSGLPSGITEEKVVTAVPPRNSLASDWLNLQSLTGNILFYLSCPAGSIIDIQLTCTLAAAFVTPANITVTTGVVGTAYFLALDKAGGTSNIAPLGLPTTT